MGVRARATGTRKTAENKLGGFKNFTISASSDPRIALAAAFFPSPLSSGVAASPFRLARHFAVALLPTVRFLLPRLFHNNTPAAISCMA